jgi:hypothetical protein
MSSSWEFDPSDDRYYNRSSEIAKSMSPLQQVLKDTLELTQSEREALFSGSHPKA